MSPRGSRLARITRRFQHTSEQSSPDNPNTSPSVSRSASESRQPTIKQQAEAYIPSWQRLEVPGSSSTATATTPTGRRKAASVSGRSTPNTYTDSARHRRNQSDEVGGNMLYFGEGASPSRRTTGLVASSSSSNSTAAHQANSSRTQSVLPGRDASGYLATGVTSSNIMSGTYSSLTYGGSIQSNFALNQGVGF